MSNNPEEWCFAPVRGRHDPKCVTAFANLKKNCEAHLKGCYSIEIIDLLENPKLAEGDQILAIPTLVRKLPEPIKKIIGICPILKGCLSAWTCGLRDSFLKRRFSVFSEGRGKRFVWKIA